MRLAAGSGYQALVCIFLSGGNDGHNTVIPISTAQQSFSLYQSARGRWGWRSPRYCPSTTAATSTGCIRNAGDSGPLQRGPRGGAGQRGHAGAADHRAAYNTNNSSIVPNALFSHSDQAGQWQSSIPTGLGNTGWGGRIADLLQSSNAGATFPAMTSTNGSSLFLTGQQTFAANVPSGSATVLNYGNAARQAGLQQLLTFDNGLQLVQAANGTLGRGQSYANALSAALAGSTLATQFPAGNPLAAQLQTVARIIKVRGALGLSRQIFYCELDGFDTHSGQLASRLGCCSS
jgi:uncharacterized protein (DUF1501 family)